MTPVARVDTVVVSDRIVTATEVFEGAVAIKVGRIVALGPQNVLLCRRLLILSPTPSSGWGGERGERNRTRGQAWQLRAC